MEQQKPLLLQSLSRWLTQKARAYRVPLIASLLFGFLAYGFNFTNKLVNHDEVECLFAKGGSAVLGRWGLDVMERIFPNVSMPWIYGIITLVLMAVSICVICRIFNIRSRLLQVLLAGSIVVFPSLTSTMAYMFTASSYAVAFLCAVTAVYLMQKHTKYSILGALALMVFSLSIYQAYVAVTASFFLLLLIQQMLKGEEVKAALRSGVEYLLFLIVSLIAYYVSVQLVLLLTGQSFSSYATGNMDLTLGDIPGKILMAYERFFLYFRRVTLGCGLITTPLSRKMHYLLALAAIILLVLWLLQQKKIDLPRLLMLAAMLFLLPLAVNCMFLFTTEDAVHTLVLYGFVAVYVLVIILADLFREYEGFAPVKRLSLEVITLTMAVILISNIYVANETSLNLYLRYQNAHAFYTSLAADLKMMPEFGENTRVAIAGEYPSPDFYHENLTDVYHLAGAAGFFPNNYSKEKFVTYYVGFPMHFASDEEVNAIMATPEYAQMSCYPYYGSMKFFDNILVVKLS